MLGNYTITRTNGDLHDHAESGVGDAERGDQVYGAADPALTGTLSGFLVADGVTATYTRTAGETVLGSPYTISATLAPAGVLSNYNITTTPRTSRSRRRRRR